MLKSFQYKIRSRFIDIGKPDNLIILAGMGRSGTTWAGNIINHDNTYRILFEPFFPAKVREAHDFEYIQYLHPRHKSSTLSNAAKLILSGNIHNNWIDIDNNRLFYLRRIIKDIRCNLMLGWLKRMANNPPIVLMIRHPLQVACSWSKLGWGKEANGNRSDLDIITSQEPLLNDFPIIRDVMKRIDLHDFVEKIVFQWCVFHLIPSHHLKKTEAHALFYENLIINTETELFNLFNYLNTPFNINRLKITMEKPSWTNFLGRDFSKNQSQLVNSWKNLFSSKQIHRSEYILAAFGLDHIYDKNGYPTGAQIFRG